MMALPAKVEFTTMGAEHERSRSETGGGGVEAVGYHAQPLVPRGNQLGCVP